MSKAEDRDYKRERALAVKRGETGVGAKSGDAMRHKARRKYIKENGVLSSSTHVNHNKPLKSGGGNKSGNLSAKEGSANYKEGGGLGKGKQKNPRKKKGEK